MNNNEHMSLWNKVCDTEPGTTKPVTYGRKYTAIDAYTQIRRATSIWGEYGKTWGLKSIKVTDMGDYYLLFEATFFAPEIEFPIINSVCPFLKEKFDDDWAKKTTTDTITKALSYLGFNADIFTGDWDSNRNVAKATHNKNNTQQKRDDELPPAKVNGVILVKEASGDVFDHMEAIKEGKGYMRILATRLGKTEEQIVREYSHKENNGKVYEATCIEALVTKNGTAWLDETVASIKQAIGGK